MSNPHTSENNSISVTFLKIYVEIWINDMSFMHSQKFTFKNQVKARYVANLQMLPDVCSLCEQLPE